MAAWPWNDGRSQVLEEEGFWGEEHTQLACGLWGPGLGRLHAVGVQRMSTEKTWWKQDRNVSGTLAEGGRRPPVAATAV